MVKYAQFEVLDVFPRMAAPLGTVTLRLTGTLFPERLTAVLQDTGGSTRQRQARDIYHFR